MKRFHIKITDNKTGKILLCKNFDVIIGAAASSDEDEVPGFAYMQCDKTSLISAAITAQDVVHEAIEELPWKLRRKVRRFNYAKYIKNKKEKGE